MTTTDAQVPTTMRRGWWAERACDAAATLLIVAALIVSLRTVAGLQLPYDPDHFRDLAFAQTALDGHPLSDASFAGEWIWYNPLVPWIVAALAWMFGTTPAVAHLTAGPFLNLLGPVGLYLLARRVAGRPAALVTLTSYLFLLCTENCWACATYSPWLFTSTFSQGLFFFSVLALLIASERRTVVSAGVAGLLAGVTFLSHTAPALLLALIGLVLLPLPFLLTCGLIAATVASPFIVSIVGHYHLHVLNRAPLHWDYGPLLPAALPGTVRANAIWFALALAGFAWVRTRAVVAWFSGSVLLLAWSMTSLAVVPTFHAWIYLMAATALMAGVTVSRVLRAPAAVLVVVSLAAAWHWPAYERRQDFTVVRDVATSWDPNFPAMSAALRRVSTPDDVVLGTHGAANLIIGPAGRKVVAPHPFMANPYVAIDARLAARDAMLQAVQAHDAATFTPLAERYDVRFVMAVGKAECAAAETFEPLVPVQRLGDVCLERIR